MNDEAGEIKRQMSNWWATSISDISPGVIRFRGHDIPELMNDWDFLSVVTLMVMNKELNPMERKLLNMAFIASVDHGPQAPSIAAARMAATCGVGLNNAVATGVNLLGDTHGGAGQQCLELYLQVEGLRASGSDLPQAAEQVVNQWRMKSKYLPGFGHRFHPRDPRRDPIVALLEKARDQGAISGKILEVGLAIENHINLGRTKQIPMNIDGATAIIYGELGFPPKLARGLFVLARSVGILAHSYEEMESGSRIKGPMPTSVLPTYLGR